ncbi:MAG: DHH family phosphoesterase, partial [Candidatus Omnitrophica bacterium]|nr:DHH family phosphoesterase [Candidatus Omnitrophota bacterium]
MIPLYQEKTNITKHARKILRFLEAKKESISPLLIVTHDYPDPDALASAFALQYLAENFYGVASKIVYGGIVGRVENRAMVGILKMPVHKLKAADFKKYNRVALVDTQPVFENNAFPKNRKATLVIDQHPSVERPAAELSIVDTECGATSTILAQCLLLLRIEIPVRIATALAYGILTDTMNLYRAKHAEVIDIYLDILSRSDLWVLAHIQNPPRSRRFFMTLGQGIQNAAVRR